MELSLSLIIEAMLLTCGEPLTVQNMIDLFPDDAKPTVDAVEAILEALMLSYDQSRPCELKQVSEGYRLQVRTAFAPYLAKRFEEKIPRYSRAALETLALIAYRQPITRAQIGEIRGVAVNSTIIKSLLEREWIRVVGHKETPGRPELFATTKQFLSDMNLTSLAELPTLQAITDVEALLQPLQKEIPFSEPMAVEIALAGEGTEIQAEIELDTDGTQELSVDAEVVAETAAGLAAFAKDGSARQTALEHIQIADENEYFVT